jgi:hypothetical protein
MKFNIWIVVSFALMPPLVLIAGMAVSDALPRASLDVLAFLAIVVIAVVAAARHSIDAMSQRHGDQ